MRLLVLLAWLLLPIGVGIWHYGPGQDYQTLDEVSQLLARADGFAATGEWDQAVEAYEQALKRLPQDRLEASRRIRLEKAKAQMLAKQLSLAHADLNLLCDELQADPKADKKLLSQSREALAQAQFYMTWLLRVEGHPREVWEPEIEAARQNYRLLAEESRAGGDRQCATKHEQDLEAAVRLARMDLSELQGLPLPSQ